MGADGRVVRVKDIGRVELGALSYTAQGYADKLPGRHRHRRPAAGLQRGGRHPGHQGRHGASWRKSFPKGLEYRITYNPTEFIEVSIKKLYGTILEATVLVVLVVLLFLKTWRATLIPVVAIPVSLVGTFAVMQGVRLLAQHADPVRAGAGGRHRRRRRHRRGGERRAQAEGGAVAARRPRASPWTRSAPR